METEDKILITVPESPYQILDAQFGADARRIQAAFRAFFKKNPRKGMKVGKKAQRQLIDPKERAKVDALCCLSERPDVDLNGAKSELTSHSDEGIFDAVKKPVKLSDLFFPEALDDKVPVDLDFPEIAYRKDYGNAYHTHGKDNQACG